MAIEPLLASRAQKAFIITISFQAVVVLVMIAIVFRLVEDEVTFTGGYKTLPCYLALFALAEIFELFMAFDALRMRNVIQLIGILLFHLALIVFSALQVRQTRTALVKFSDADCAESFDEVNCDGPGSLWRRVEPYLIVTPCVIAASWLSILFCTKQLYEEFGWAIFHVVGANPKMKTMYQWYQIMICFLKFDFFFFTGVTMQLLIVVLSRNSAEFAITIIAIPIVLILLGLCGVAVQREIKWIMTISLVMMLAAESYLSLFHGIQLKTRPTDLILVYKLVRFYEPASRAQYATTRATLTIFTIVAFLLLFATFAVGLRCFADFEKGLMESKVHGQSYTPVKNDVKMQVLNGDSIPALSDKPNYLPSGDSAGMGQPQGSYLGGSALGQRISIE
ncbi:hypothetical protein ARMSODRAFT_1010740 [Armillaria solidipes]|uniref:Uncharacterized protein n=1 Tax=Armillaria solidipes TaxID=1076256 RepID=A0A2H3CS58_9AGAR|nr:hypothetical protein ARMSODRAFT_1010740 [Armillaria solidipes]